MRDSLRLIGHYRIKIRNAAGRVREFQEGSNLITDVGRRLVAALALGQGGASALSHIGVGDNSTGGTAPSQLDTLLDTEHININTGAGTRYALTKVTVNVATAGDAAELQVTGTVTNDSAGTILIAEAGIFNSGVFPAAQTGPASGNMFSRWLLSSFTLQISESFDYDYIVSIGA